MTTENIIINIREDGARVVQRNILDIAAAADQAAARVNNLNTTLTNFLNIAGRLSSITSLFQQLAGSVGSLNQTFNTVNNTTNNFNQTLITVNNSVINIVNSGNRMTTVFGAIKSLLGGLSVVYLADKFFEMADAVTQLDGRLRIVTKSAQDYNMAQEDIYRISQVNNTGLKETGSLYTKLYDPVMRLGGGAKEVAGIVEAFGAALKIGGASASESASSVLQFAQAMGSGKLAGDEFRSLAENSPRFMQVLADSLDVPTGALKGLSSQGQLTSDVIANALLKNLDKLRAEAVNVGNTVSGAFSDLNNDATRTVGWFDKMTGASGMFANQVEGLSLLLFQMGKVFKDEVADGTKVATTGLDGMAITMRVVGSVLETILLLSSDVVYVFKGIGREIGGIAAQFAAVLSGNFKDVATIRSAMQEDNKNAETELKRYQDRIGQITNEALKARDAMNTGPGSDDMTMLKATSSEKDLFEARSRLAGITKNYFKDLNALYKSYEDGKLSQSEYVGLVEELATKTYAASTAGKDLTKANKENDKLNRQYEQSFGSLIEKIAEKDAVLKLSLTSETKLTEAEKFAAKVMEDMKNGTLGLVAARGMSIDQQKRIIAAKLEEYVIDDRNLTLRKEEEKANAKSIKELSDEADKMQEKTQKQIEANDLIGKTKAMIDDLKAIRLNDAAASDEQTASGIRLNAIYSPESTKQLMDYAAELDRLAKAKRGLATALFAGAEKEEEKAATDAMKKAAKKYEDEFEKSSNKIEEGLYNAIGRGGEAGFKKLMTDVKSWFARLVLEPIIKPIANFGASLITGGSASGEAGAGTSIMSMFNQGSSLFTIGKTIYNGFASGVAGSLGTVVSGIGNLFGSTAASSFGAGLGMSASQAATASAAYSAAVAEGTISATAGTAAAGGISAGASAAAAIPVIGWIIAGMAAANGFRKEGFTANNGTITGIGKAISAPTNMTNTVLEKLGVGGALANILSGASINTKLFGRADPRMESQGFRGTVNTEGLTGESYAKIIEKGGIFRSSKRYEIAGGLDANTDKEFDNTIKGIVATVKSFAGILGNDGSALNGFSKTFDIKTTGDKTKDSEIITKFFSDLGDEMANKLVPSLKDFTAEGETAAATLQRVTGNYAAVQAVIVASGSTMQKAFGAVGEAALKSTEQLIAAAGGIENLDSLVGFFSQNFLTAAEQLAPVQQTLNEQLAKLGYGAVTTSEQYKQAVLDLTNSGKLATKEGADTYVALLALGPAFKTVTDALKETTKAAEEQAAKQLELTNKRLSMQLTIANLENNTAAAVAIIAEQRRLELAAMDPLLRPYQERINALNDEADALEKTAAALEKANSLRDKSLSMQLTIADLESNSSASTAIIAQQRAIELSAMDASLRPLQERINLLTDEKAAIDKLKGVASDAFAALSGNINLLKDKAKANLDAQVAVLNAQASSAKELYDKQIDAAKATLDATKSLQTSLTSTLNSFAPAGTTADNRASAIDQIKRALDVAKATGVLPKAEDIAGALKTASQSNEEDFSSRADYNRDLYVTAGRISELNALTGKQVDKAQLALDVATKAKDDAAKFYTDAIALAQKAYDSEIAQYDLVLKLAQSQLDAMNGTQLAIKDMGSLLAAFTSSVNNALALIGKGGGIAAPGATPGGGQITKPATASADDVTSLYKTILGRDPEAGAVDWWTKTAAEKNLSGAELISYFYSSDEYIKSHSHANGGIASGWSMVGERGPEMVNFTNPARVYTAQQTAQMMGSGDWSEVAAAIEGLNAGLEMIYDEVKRGADGSEQSGDMLYKVTGGGGAMVIANG